MFLSKRNGIYYLWYQDDQGKRKKASTHATTKSDALKFLSQFSFEAQSRKQQIPRLGEFKDRVLEYVKANYALGTYRIYKENLNRLLAQVGDIPISKITPYHFDLYKSKRMAEVAPETTNMGLRNIKATMGFAVRWKLLESNPFSKLSLASVPERSPNFFSREEFTALVGAIDKPWFKEIVIFGLLTGMREGEILNLTWNSVDVEKGIVRVECSPNFKTKAGKRRTLPLNEAVLSLLMSKGPRQTNDLVFPLNSKRIDKYWVNRLFRRYREAAKLTKPLTFHSLRHTFASWLALDGVSIYQISKLLGHSDVSVTQTYYAHLQTDELRDTVNRISISLD